MKKEYDKLNDYSYNFLNKLCFKDKGFSQYYHILEKISPIRTNELYGVQPEFGILMTNEYRLLRERSE